MTIPLRVRDLSAGYGEDAVIHHLSLEVDHGDVVAIVGPNGSGKSTLLRSLLNATPASTGEVELWGEPLAGVPTGGVVARGVGYLRQQNNFFPSLSVDDNLRLASGMAETFRHRAPRILRILPEIAAHLGTRAGLLSGGQRQLLALAITMMGEHRLLLLDEPWAGLSERYATDVRNCIQSVAMQEASAILIVEHRLRQLLPIVNRVVILVRGTIAIDTRDVSILTNRAELERHYRL